MSVLLLQLDGKLPNVALMRIAAHHRARGDHVELRRAGNAAAVSRRLGDDFDHVYASLIFLRTRAVAEAVRREYPDAIIGGTGWDLASSLAAHGITTTTQDYSIYPDYQASMGFTQRGCRLRCKFCVVPQKEGAVRVEQTVRQIWRGEPWPRDLALLDNDFFGHAGWRENVEAINAGGFRVSLLQGINARFLNDESAAAMASMNYRSLDFRTRRIYTAWDSLGDEKRLFAGLEALVRNGVKPDNIMVYTLIGYAPGETHDDRDVRRRRLRAFGARPYPMPYERTPELLAFQRWVVGAYDKQIPWDEWTEAKWNPRKLQRRSSQLPLI
jgi:hypothetical protein